MKTIIISGYFDPIHIGHLEYMKMARSLGDRLIVIVNSDEQAVLKKGRAFMPEQDRLMIVKAIRHVDNAIVSRDKMVDVADSIRHVALDMCPGDELIFANGGDRPENTVPSREQIECDVHGIEMVYGLGDKIRSSGTFISEAQNG